METREAAVWSVETRSFSKRIPLSSPKRRALRSRPTRRRRAKQEREGQKRSNKGQTDGRSEPQLREIKKEDETPPQDRLQGERGEEKETEEKEKKIQERDGERGSRDAKGWNGGLARAGGGGTPKS